MKTPIVIIPSIFLFIVCLIVQLIGGCSTVGTGEAGVFAYWGEVRDMKPVGEGIYLYVPFRTHLKTYDVKTQVKKFKTQTFTKDIQTANLEFSVTFNLDREKVPNLHVTTGRDYVEKLISPAAIASVKDAFGKWEAAEVVSKREDAARLILGTMASRLKEYGVIVTAVNILDIGYSDAFEKSVEQKQVAMQNAIRAKNETARIEEEARQAVVKAEAEAKSMEVRAKALERNKSLVLYEAVKQWDGKLPQYMLGDHVPMLNIPASDR